MIYQQLVNGMEIKSNFINIFYKFRSSNKKLFNNSIAFSSVFFIQLTIQIIYPPMMIWVWGADNFGVILFLLAIPAALSFLIINFASPARQEMARIHLNKNVDGVNKIYSNTVILLSISYFIYFIGSFFFLKYANLGLLNNFINTNDVNLILILIFISALINLFEEIFSLKISYLGVYHITKYIELTVDFLIKISMLFIGFYSQSFVQAFIIYLILYCIKILLFYYYATKIKNISCSISKISKSYIKDLSIKSYPYYFLQIEEIIKTSLVILIIGNFFDFKTVAFVSTIRTMFYFFPRKFFELISDILQFEYVKLLTNKKLKKLKKMYIRQNLITFSLATIYLILSYLIGLKIYDLWTNNQFLYETKLFYFLILDCFFFLLTGSIISFLKSINNFFSISIYLFISQLILLTMVYLAYKNNYDYDVFFIYSFFMSFVVFCISIFYFKKALNYMKRK